MALENPKMRVFFSLKDQADQILAVQIVLILDYLNESKARVIKLCYVPGLCSKWSELVNLKFGLLLVQMLSVNYYRLRSFCCYRYI